MRKLLLAALLAVFPSIAHAQFGYVEGSVGIGLYPDIETNDYTFITSQGELFEGNAESSIDASWAFGAEVGFQTGPWRFGACSVRASARSAFGCGVLPLYAGQ